jgi:hypothetical protein
MLLQKRAPGSQYYPLRLLRLAPPSPNPLSAHLTATFGSFSTGTMYSFIDTVSIDSTSIKQYHAVTKPREEGTVETGTQRRLRLGAT